MTERRTFNTPLREPWNPIVYQCLRAVDCHNEQYFLTGNVWHLEQSELLRHYVRSLKDWIREEEEKMVPSLGHGIRPQGGNEWKRSRHYCLRANSCFYFILNNKFLYRGRRLAPLAQLKGCEAGLRRNRRLTGAASTLLISEESLQFSTKSRKASIDEDTGNQWPLGFCRSSRSLAPFTSAVRSVPNIPLSIVQRQPLRGELLRCSAHMSCCSLRQH